MPVKHVLPLGTPSLWEPSAEATNGPETRQLVDDLHDTLLHWRRTTGYGRGIAAPQIGLPRRVVVLDLGTRWPMLDPVIEDRSPERLVLWDACLSFLDIFFTVERHAWIEVSYTDLDGTRHRLRAEDDLSELLQHEIDHLDGVLALERMSDVRSMCTRKYFEKHHRAESPYRLEYPGSSP